MRLGALIAQVEGAAALVRRAQRAADKELNEKGSRRLRAKALAAASRVSARNAALSVPTEGVRCVAGADGDLGELEHRLDLASIHRAQGGLLADLEQVREAVYGRMRP